jgi:DNA-binding IclR family transcriptional regulator
VLNFISAGRGPSYGILEVSEGLDISRNMAFRAMSVLAELGYLVRDPTGRRYQLGWNVLTLFNPQTIGADFRALCAGYLRRIHAITGESVSFIIPVGMLSMMIDGVEGQGDRVGRIIWGHPLPLYDGAGSRAILSCFGDDEIAHYLKQAGPLKQRTGQIMSAKRLWEEINKIRKQGYALSIPEYVPNRSQHIAWPILDIVKRPHGVVSISGPADRLSVSRIRSLLSTITPLIAELNEQSQTMPSTALAFV